MAISADVKVSYDNAKAIAQIFLKKKSEPTTADITIAVALAASASESESDIKIDQISLIRDLETLYSTWISAGSILESQTSNHEDWLEKNRPDIKWRFWERCCEYLKRDKGRPPKLLASLDETTDAVLSRLENPTRPGEWSRRGMVVGHVQSGKTGNYTGLICKAADAGYNLIIVLAGIHNSLRSQTQRRLDEEFLGFDSRVYREDKSSKICAGLIRTTPYLLANSATSSDQKGDFSKTVMRQYNLVIGGNSPVLLVVKKNKSVLNNVIRWATAHRAVKNEAGRNVVRGIPLLVIDDESDQASINTEKVFDENGLVDPDYEPAVINSLIRKLLNSFEQNAYVGYTATPFANIFIHPSINHNDFGRDLFPESFIVSLPAPSNYVGPEKIFGMKEDVAAGLTEQSSLGITKIIEDQEKWLPLAHKKDFEPGELPESLKLAIRSFILVCAIRHTRGHVNEHNSMLVHVTRFKEVQGKVARQVSEELKVLQNRIRYKTKKSTDNLLAELRQQWEDDFRSKTFEIAGENDDWNAIEAAIVETCSQIKVKKINGESADVLEYCEQKSIDVIAVGGNKLSRGLTLEGLSVSYYLRASRMYDTLMQMGRWFGYRPGYVDLCRLYTTKELVEWYRHITIAAEELRQEFDEMASRNATPREFGLRVRSHPSGLDVTAVNKMRSGYTMKLSYDGTTTESVSFAKSQLTHNFSVLENLISNLKNDLPAPKCKENGTRIWTNVDAGLIAEFLATIETHPSNRRCRGDLLGRYLKMQLAQNELKNWTVALINVEKGTRFKIADLEVGLVKRDFELSPDHFTLKKVVSPIDETIDLTEEQYQSAMAETQKHRLEKNLKDISSKVPLGWTVRRQRKSNNGLLLLYPLDPYKTGQEFPPVGFALCFPSSTTASKIAYQVNNIYWEEEFGA